ncbi:MAG: tetratricopeptide repeat protein [Fimbriimonadaceae bacterium]|nr:tetratricopeptide repeat protein [Fimbriimonadaceae bacterium]
MDIDALWDFNDPAASEDRFRKALIQAEAPELQAELKTQLARSLGLQRRFDDAHALLDEVVELPDPSPRLRVRYLLERGRACNSGGDPEQARPLFVEAWNVATETGQDALAVDAAHMVAIASPTAEQMGWNEKALALALASPDPNARRWRASLANNMGWTLHDQGRYDEALSKFEEALRARRELGDPRTEAIARWCVARCLRSLGRLEEALAMQVELVDEDPTGYAHEERAECLLELGRKAEAAPWFAKAAEKLADTLGDDPAFEERLARLRELGMESS